MRGLVTLAVLLCACSTVLYVCLSAGRGVQRSARGDGGAQQRQTAEVPPGVSNKILRESLQVHSPCAPFVATEPISMYLCMFRSDLRFLFDECVSERSLLAHRPEWQSAMRWYSRIIWNLKVWRQCGRTTCAASCCYIAPSQQDAYAVHPDACIRPACIPPLRQSHPHCLERPSLSCWH